MVVEFRYENTEFFFLSFFDNRAYFSDGSKMVELDVETMLGCLGEILSDFSVCFVAIG